MQNNQEEIPIVQEAVANKAVATVPVPVAPVQPNLIRNQVLVILSCKFKLHPYIYDARISNRISKNRTLSFGYSKHETKRAYVLLA